MNIDVGIHGGSTTRVHKARTMHKVSWTWWTCKTSPYVVVKWRCLPGACGMFQEEKYLTSLNVTRPLQNLLARRVHSRTSTEPVNHRTMYPEIENWSNMYDFSLFTNMGRHTLHCEVVRGRIGWKRNCDSPCTLRRSYWCTIASTTFARNIRK